MSSVELRGVVKGWNGSPVVHGTDLQIAQGERFTLLGPSGCGKTTILRMIAELEVPDAGSIRLGDELVAGEGVLLPPEARRLGMVFQSYAVWPHRNVRDNVAYPLRLQGVADADAQAEAALTKVKLAGMGDRMPGMLSGGQQQRVAAARALAAKPRVLLPDEPLSNVNAALREELGAEIAALAAQEGLNVVMVTHDQSEALALSDRIGVLHSGLLQQVGTPTELYASPKNLRVARATGAIGEIPAERRGGQVLGKAPGADGPVALAVRPEEASFATAGVPCAVRGRLYRGAGVRWRVEVAGVKLNLDTPVGAAATGFLALSRVRTLEKA